MGFSFFVLLQMSQTNNELKSYLVLVSLCCYILILEFYLSRFCFSFFVLLLFSKSIKHLSFKRVLVSLCCYLQCQNWYHEKPASFSFFVLLQPRNHLYQNRILGFSFFVLLRWQWQNFREIHRLVLVSLCCYGVKV